MNLYLVDECLYVIANSEEEAIKVYQNEIDEIDPSVELIEKDEIINIKVYDLEESTGEYEKIDMCALFDEAENVGESRVLLEIEL